MGPPHSAHQLSAPDPRVDLTSGGSERKSVTDTDLITAGGSGENVELPQTQTVNSDISSSQDGAAATLQTARPPRKPRPRPTSRRAIAPRPCRPWCCPNCVRWPRRSASRVRPECARANSSPPSANAAASPTAVRRRRPAATRPTPPSLQPTPRPRPARPSRPPRSRPRRAASVAAPLAGPARRRLGREQAGVRPAEQGRHRR